MHVILSPYYTIEAYILYIVQLLQRAFYDRARSALCGILLLNLLCAPNLSIDQPYLDPMGGEEELVKMSLTIPRVSFPVRDGGG